MSDTFPDQAYRLTMLDYATFMFQLVKLIDDPNFEAIVKGIIISIFEKNVNTFINNPTCMNCFIKYIASFFEQLSDDASLNYQSRLKIKSALLGYLLERLPNDLYSQISRDPEFKVMFPLES